MARPHRRVLGVLGALILFALAAVPSARAQNGEDASEPDLAIHGFLTQAFAVDFGTPEQAFGVGAFGRPDETFVPVRVGRVVIADGVFDDLRTSTRFESAPFDVLSPGIDSFYDTVVTVGVTTAVFDVDPLACEVYCEVALVEQVPGIPVFSAGPGIPTFLSGASGFASFFAGDSQPPQSNFGLAAEDGSVAKYAYPLLTIRTDLVDGVALHFFSPGARPARIVTSGAVEPSIDAAWASVGPLFDASPVPGLTWDELTRIAGSPEGLAAAASIAYGPAAPVEEGPVATPPATEGSTETTDNTETANNTARASGSADGPAAVEEGPSAGLLAAGGMAGVGLLGGIYLLTRRRATQTKTIAEEVSVGEDETDLSGLLESAYEQWNEGRIEELAKDLPPDESWSYSDGTEDPLPGESGAALPLSSGSSSGLAELDPSALYTGNDGEVMAEVFQVLMEQMAQFPIEMLADGVLTIEEHVAYLNLTRTPRELRYDFRYTVPMLMAAQNDAPANHAVSTIEPDWTVDFLYEFGVHFWDDLASGRARDRLFAYQSAMRDPERIGQAGKEYAADMRQSFVTAYDGWLGIWDDPARLSGLDEAASTVVDALKERFRYIAELARTDDPRFVDEMQKLTHEAMIDAALGKAGDAMLAKLPVRLPRGGRTATPDAPRAPQGIPDGGGVRGPDAHLAGGPAPRPATPDRSGGVGGERTASGDLDGSGEFTLPDPEGHPLDGDLLGDPLDGDLLDLGSGHGGGVLDGESIDVGLELFEGQSRWAIPNPAGEIAPAAIRRTVKEWIEYAWRLLDDPTGYGVESGTKLTFPNPGSVPVQLQQHVNSCVFASMRSALEALGKRVPTSGALRMMGQRLGVWKGTGLGLNAPKAIVDFMKRLGLIDGVDVRVFDLTRATSPFKTLDGLCNGVFKGDQFMLRLEWPNGGGHAVRLEKIADGFAHVSDPGLPSWMSLKVPASAIDKLVTDCWVFEIP